MVLILLATVLIAVIAFFQVTQGFYSAMIMAVVSVLSAAVAMAFYEPLAALLRPHQPDAADAIALLGIFIVLVVGLRLACDIFLKRNVVLGVWTNRLGGGVLGLVAGTTLVGVLAVAMQMLPWGPSVLGYRPFDDSLRRSGRLYLFAPDDFVVGTIKAVSPSLTGASSRRFAAVHDDLLLELFCARNTAGKNGRTDAKANALSVENFYLPEQASWAENVPLDPRLGDQVTKLLVVHATVNRSAADTDGWWRLPATHFRLVGESGRSYYPLGYVGRSAAGAIEPVLAPSEEGALQITQLIVEQQTGKEKNLSVDWVYRVLLRDDADGYDTPDTLIFRRASQASVPKPAARMFEPTGGPPPPSLP